MTDPDFIIKKTNSKPAFVLSQNYCNTLSKDGQFIFRKTTQTSSQASWTVSEGISTGTAWSIKIGYPRYFGGSFSTQKNITFSKTDSSIETHLESWEIDITVPVPSQQSVNASFMIIENEYDATWESDVVFNGCIVSQLKNSYQGSLLFKQNVYEVFNNKPNFTCWKDTTIADSCRASFCKFKVKGTFNGVAGAQSFLETNQSTCLRGLPTLESE